ncbi:hypothetical protein [Ferroacidibacillus organovorans]|uniref:hypothetical protein n=1 Tax=Ferroacidibacillus organovorans TaxID=1765683 RepID=UPI00128F3FA8|nr:hypothetical protein [Ferroacidibacillus organovorans]
MAVTKEELHLLVDRIDDPIELESVYAAMKSIIEHDDQACYWSERWQEGEREADADRVANRVSQPFDSVQELMHKPSEGTRRRAERMRLEYSKRFGKRLRTLSKGNKSVIPQVEKTLLQLHQFPPAHPALRMKRIQGTDDCMTRSSMPRRLATAVLNFNFRRGW